MLNHKNLIENLTPDQKIALLVDTGAQGDEVSDVTDLPRLYAADLWASNKTETAQHVFPDAASLANSFDGELFAKVAKQLVRRGRELRQNLFILPNSKAPYHVYGEGLSEDPLLTAQLVKASADALCEERAAICMHAPSLTASEVEFLGGEVDVRTLYDRTARPFCTALSNARVQAVMLPKEPTPQAYAAVSEVMMRDALPSRAALLCADVEHDDTIPALYENKLLLGASADALKAALDNYNRIRRSVEEGGSTVEELNTALLSGAAVSEEMLDAALDRRLELALLCDKLRGSAKTTGEAVGFSAISEGTDGQESATAQAQAAHPHQGHAPVDGEMRELALLAARESIVLLKNQNKILPLATRKRIALIGDVINENEEGGFCGFREQFTEQMEQGKHRFAGFAKGYHLERDRSEELIPEAIKLARNADVLLVFLGMGKRREARIGQIHSLQLPANQLALLEALSRTGKPIVAIIAGSRLPAMAFDRRADAVLLMPSEGMMVPTALAEVLDARYNPSGRLAYAGHDDPDADFRELQKHIRAGKRKTGPFIGYRYSVSEGLAVKYPFGFGMSYGEFAYSDLTVNGASLRFALQNKGRRAGIETVQLYVGKSDSAILRPRVELKKVLRVALRAGERKWVQIRLEDLGVYDPQAHALVTEGGAYEIYVSSSSGNACLKQRMTLSGKTLPAQEYELSDYLHTVSDIRSNSYTMEASCEPMKNRTALKTVGMLLMVLTLFADVIYLTCGMLTFLDLYASYFAVSIVSAVLVGAGLVLLIVYGGIRKRALHLQRLREKEATEKLFRDAEPVEGESIEELFVEEFDIPEEQVKRENETYTEEDEGLYAYMEVDAKLPSVAHELEKFFRERGVAMTPELAKTVISALMTSRLLVVRTELRRMLDTFVTLLAEFFGTEAYHDTFAKEGTTSLLQAKSYNGTVRESNVLHALYAAQNQQERAHFVGLSDVRLNAMGSVLMPYIRYFSNPQNVCTVKENELTVTVPSNIWFVLGVADGEAIEDIEPFVANYAAVVDLTAEWCEEKTEKAHSKALLCAEMEALVYRAKRSITVDEDLWKSVDRMETYVNERAPYHIGNKLFLLMERYLAVYVGCGGDIQSAMDSAITVKLLPAILALLKNNANPDDLDFVHTLESIFGEENVTCAAYMLKHAVLQMEPEQEQPTEVAVVSSVSETGEALQEGETSEQAPLATLRTYAEWNGEELDEGFSTGVGEDSFEAPVLPQAEAPLTFVEEEDEDDEEEDSEDADAEEEDTEKAADDETAEDANEEQGVDKDVE